MVRNHITIYQLAYMTQEFLSHTRKPGLTPGLPLKCRAETCADRVLPSWGLYGYGAGRFQLDFEGEGRVREISIVRRGLGYFLLEEVLPIEPMIPYIRDQISLFHLILYKSEVERSHPPES